MDKLMIEEFVKRIVDINKLSRNRNIDKITRGEHFLLGLIKKEGMMSQAELSRKMGVSDARLTNIVKALENKGLIERIQSEKDKRVSYIDLSLSGLDYFDDKVNEGLECILKLMDGVTDEEFGILLEVLDKIINNIRKDKNNE